MSLRRLRQLPAFALALLLCLWAVGPAFAQAPTRSGVDGELEALKQAYDYANFAQVLERAEARIDRGGLSREQLVEWHKYAALAAFTLNKSDAAERHFSAMLLLAPDYALDPYTVAPPAIASFEAIRKKLAPQLDVVRQQLRIEQERLRREEEELAKKAEEEKKRQALLDEMARRVTIRNVERHSYLVNFVPFGAGQFDQGRTGMGVAMATTQGAFALTSIISYLAYEGLVTHETVTLNTLPKPTTIQYDRIPEARRAEATAWRYAKYISAIGFYAAYSFGVGDSLYHHQDQTVTTTTVQLPPDAAPSEQPPPEQPAPQPKEQRDTVPLGPGVTGSAGQLQLNLFPTPGGMGAGFTLQF